MGATARKVLIIQGHPDPRGHHFGHALANAYAKGAVQAGYQVQHIAIASLDFPLLRSRDDLEHGTAPEAIRHAQSAILDADHIVLIYPVWNGGLPALVTGFLEQTFRPAFTFPNAKRDEQLGFFGALRQRKACRARRPAWSRR
jgi:putative NADPH-quinone reductase